MRTLVIHWRRRHINTDAAHALAALLEAVPGPDGVEIVTSGERIRLPVTCDASTRGLGRLIQTAIDDPACVLVRDSETPTW